MAKVEQPQVNEMIGAELGYRYQDSPLIANEPGGPEDPLRKYEPTTWPGARLPHVWLEGHTAIQDRIGRGLHAAAARGSRTNRAPDAWRAR